MLELLFLTLLSRPHTRGAARLTALMIVGHLIDGPGRVQLMLLNHEWMRALYDGAARRRAQEASVFVQLRQHGRERATLGRRGRGGDTPILTSCRAHTGW